MTAKHPVRILCSDGVVRDGYQIITDDGRIVLKTQRGSDPTTYGPPKERRTWDGVKANHHEDWDIRLSFQRDIYGKDGLDRLNRK